MNQQWLALVGAQLGRTTNDPLVEQIAMLLEQTAAGTLPVASANEQVRRNLAIAGLGPLLYVEAIPPDGFMLCDASDRPVLVTHIAQPKQARGNTFFDFGSAQVGSVQTGDQAMGDINKSYGANDEARPLPAGSPRNQAEHTRTLLQTHRQRLQRLEQRAALEGFYTPPHIMIEIDEIKAEIARLEARLRPSK